MMEATLALTDEGAEVMVELAAELRLEAALVEADDAAEEAAVAPANARG